MHTTAGLACLLLEVDQEVHHLPRIRAAIGHVTGLHEDGGPALPGPTAVDHAGILEDLHQRCQVAVHVAHHDDAGWRLSGRQANAGKKQERGEDAFHRGSGEDVSADRRRNSGECVDYAAKTGCSTPSGLRLWAGRAAVVESGRPE